MFMPVIYNSRYICSYMGNIYEIRYMADIELDDNRKYFATVI